MTDRQSRLKALGQKRLAAIKDNQRSTTAEYAAQKGPSSSKLAKQEALKEQALELKKQQEAQEQGIDYERIRNLEYSAEDVERWNEKQDIKASFADHGFTDFIQIAAKTYHRRIRDLKPNPTAYKEQQEQLESHEADLSFQVMAHQPSTQALEKLVQDVDKQQANNANRSKRRLHDDSEDVTYINHRNMHFNKKLARTYDKFTAELKGNLERGTAL